MISFETITEVCENKERGIMPAMIRRAVAEILLELHCTYPMIGCAVNQTKESAYRMLNVYYKHTDHKDAYNTVKRDVNYHKEEIIEYFLDKIVQNLDKKYRISPEFSKQITA